MSLRDSIFFATLSVLEVSELEKMCESQDFAAGEAIVNEGDSGDSMCFVASGGVNVVKGPESTFISTLGPGGVFGEMALFLPHCLRTATCVAVTDTRCLILRRIVLEDFCDRHPVAGNKIYLEMLRALAERLAATSGDLAMLMKSQVLDQDSVSDLIAKMNGDFSESSEI